MAVSQTYTDIIKGKIDFSTIKDEQINELFEVVKISTDNFTDISDDDRNLILALTEIVDAYFAQNKKETPKPKNAVVIGDGGTGVMSRAISKVLQSTMTEKASVIKQAKQAQKSAIKGIDPSQLIDGPREIYDIYNKNISEEERDAFLLANPGHVLNQYFTPKTDINELLSKGLLMYDLPTNKLVYRYMYLAGDVSEKLYKAEKQLLSKNLEGKDYSESQIAFQIAELQKVVPINKRIDAVNPDDKIYLVPHSEFAKRYLITKLKDSARIYLANPTSLYEIFSKIVLKRIPEREFTLALKSDVQKYIDNNILRLDDREKRSIDEDKQKELIEDRKQKAKKEGDLMFAKFLEEYLTDEDIQMINSEWNRKFNGTTECQWDKIPVVFSFSKVFKDGDNLRLTDTQRNGLAFRQVNMSAMLGYDVGVGKTITSIGCTANAFEVGDAKRALFVVPDATYKKWIYEIAGGKDKDGKWMYGAAPQFQLFAWGNLNADITFNEIKDYTKAERELIELLIATKKQFNAILSKPEYYRERESELQELVKSISNQLIDNKSIDSTFIKPYNSVNFAKFGYDTLMRFVEARKEEIAQEININIYTLGKIKHIPEKSIVLLNYTGMVRLGMGEESRLVLRNELYNILSQGDLEPKDEASLAKKIDESIGKSMRDERLLIDEMGIDMLVIDEAHNMKKSFTRVMGEATGDKDKNGDMVRETKRYSIDSGEPSNQGIHAFCLSQYIANIAKGVNLMLTATPFTNSPLEVYSMLALTKYKRLGEMGVNNIKTFFDTFIREENQIVINAKNMPEVKPVIVGFNNLAQLKALIYDIIDYKTGEDAMVVRPEAISIPDTTVDKKYGGAETFLQMNALQRGYMRKIQAYITSGATLDDVCQDAMSNENMCTYVSEYVDTIAKSKVNFSEEPESTRILRGLSFQKLLAVSPYLFACNDLPCPTAKEYIEESPKLDYTMKCIKSVKDWHEARNEPVSGQVIYMNVGTRYFHLMKQYLVENIGYKENEVELVFGEITKERKEKVKERFLAGEVKVIIGSATIVEGIDLQNKSTVLHKLVPDWNPTQNNQVNGRIWRQGNEFAYVRLVSVLMADTSDVFVYQKLQEKTQRLKELLDRNSKKSQLDLDDVNPEEIKENLITDPKVKAALQIKRMTKEKDLQISVIKNELNRLEALVSSNKGFQNLHPKVVNFVNQFNEKYADYIKVRDQDDDIQAEKEYNAKGKAYVSKFDPENEVYKAEKYDVANVDALYIERISRRATYMMQKLRDFTIANFSELSINTIQEMISAWREVKSNYIKGVETLASMGMDISKMEEVVAMKNQELVDLQKEIDELPAKLEELAEANQAQREAELKKLKTLDERVAEFAALNHYMQFKMKRAEDRETIEDIIEEKADNTADNKISKVSDFIDVEKNILEKVSKKADQGADKQVSKIEKPQRKKANQNLKLRLELLKEMLEDEPGNEKLELRIELLEEMLKAA